MFFLQNPAREVANISVLIKTFQRPKTLNGAIRKIRKFYPQIPVLIADDSQEPTPIEDRNPNTRYFRLPFDSGISRGRNFLLSQVETDYFLLMDDDHYFNRKTDLNKMLQILQRDRFDLLSCHVYQRSTAKRDLYRKRLIDFYFNIELERETLKFLNGYHEKSKDCVVCDIVHNFFIAKTKSVAAIQGWDDRLKVAEHGDFFIRMKAAQLKVGYTPEVRVDHVYIVAERFSKDYAPFRKRMGEFRKIWYEKHGLKEIVKRDGSITTCEQEIARSSW